MEIKMDTTSKTLVFWLALLVTAALLYGMVQHRTRNPHHDLFGGGQLLAVRRNLTRAESVHLCGPTFRLVVITIAVTLTIRF